jgi:16S rRNA (uracil1498-N3)-methyltransferase
MRLHRFYIQTELREKIFVEDKNLRNQLKNVFRFSTGDSLILFNGEGRDVVYQIESLGKDGLEFSLVEEREGLMQENSFYLFLPFVKRKAFEEILQKAVELGVTDIVPIETVRSIKKEFNEERSQKILMEAVEQSGWGSVPTLHQGMSLADALNDFEEVEKYILHMEGVPLNKSENEKVSGLLLGPEGGWAPEEFLLFKEKDLKLYSLGPQTLRAETAAVAGLAILSK